MLIAITLGAAVVFIAMGALRFARMNPEREVAEFAKAKDKTVVFEGELTGRVLKDTLPEALAPLLGDTVRITVQRRPPAPTEPPH